MSVHVLNYQLNCMSHTQHPSIWKTNRNVYLTVVCVRHILIIFGNEMKITLVANIFSFLLQKFSFSFVLLVEILVFISFSFFFYHYNSSSSFLKTTTNNSSSHFHFRNENITGYIPRWFTCPRAVTHPSSNRAQCRLTALIELNALTTVL